MKKPPKILKWILAFLLIIKVLATVFMFFSSELFHCLFPFSFTTEPFTIAYIFSKDKINVLIPLFAFIIIPMCYLAGFVLLFTCKRKPLIPSIFLAVPSLTDIFCMFLSISQANEVAYLAKTDELLTGKIISIAFNLLMLLLITLYTLTSYKAWQKKNN